MTTEKYKENPKKEAERLDSKRIAAFEIQHDDSPGGTIESYGIGVALTEFDAVFTGRGRSPLLAAEDALEQLAASGVSADKWSEDQIEAAIGDLDDSEETCDQYDKACFAEYCKAEGIDPEGLFSSEEQDNIQKNFTEQIDPGFGELSAAILIRFGYPDSREEALARHLDIPADDVTEESYGENNYDAGGLGEYLVLTDDEADEAAEENILQSVWAFNAEFLQYYTVEGIDAAEIEAIRGDRCEDANDALTALVKAGEGLDELVQAAIGADGRGHFLSGYDGDEIDILGPDGETFYVYRTN